MDKEALKKLFADNDGRFIPGVYNYCDRWCERCHLASRCRVYNMEKGLADGEKHAGNEKFWQGIHTNLKLAVEMMKEMAGEKGIDLSGIEQESTEEAGRKKRGEAMKHDLSVQGKKYAEESEKWLRKNEKQLEGVKDEFLKNARLGLTEGKAKESLLEVSEAVEVIHWYSFQVHIKIMRALQYVKFPDEDDDPVQNDANGSAKVALIGTERSAFAWTVLLSRFEQHEDEILHLLVLLEKIKKGILKEFPDVREFHRPGFDD
ncbi:hypothetical protein [Sinomicrobium sp. M5D2P9]